MSKKKLTILQIVSTIAFIIIVGATSYAFFSANVINDESKQSFSGQATTIELEFQSASPIISGTNIFPGWQSSASFKLVNQGNSTYYSLYIYNITNTFSIDGSISLEITSADGGGNVSKTVLPNNLSQKDLKVGILIDDQATHNYTVTVYYNNFANIDQSPDKQASFSFEIGIKAAQSGVAGGTNPA